MIITWLASGSCSELDRVARALLPAKSNHELELPRCDARSGGNMFTRMDGGAIEVSANDPEDKTNTEAIRSHLSHIAMMFGSGDFSTPMFVHGRVPPGVTTMKLMKSTIHYTYEETPAGGRIRIKSEDPIAVAAIHDFFRFQITEHETGDALEVVQK